MSSMRSLFYIIVVLGIALIFTPNHLDLGSIAESLTQPPVDFRLVEPKMRYIPAADAQNMANFIPPSAVELNLESSSDYLPVSASESDQPMLAAIVEDPSRDAVISLGSNILFHIESETFENTIALEFASLYQLDAGDQELSLEYSQRMREFEVNIVDQVTGEIRHEFDHPVRTVFDLRDYGIDTNMMGGNFYLAYQDPDEPNSWTDVPITIHDSTGLISAEVTHFSTWATGWRPEQWTFHWDPPAVSEYSGAATYSYPIELPPGRNGLQPNIALSYSSNALNGAIKQAGSGRLGTGWSLPEIAVVRSRIGINGSAITKAHNDPLRLVINGTGYKLIEITDSIEEGAKNGGDKVYIAEDAPNVRVIGYISEGNYFPGITGIEDYTGGTNKSSFDDFIYFIVQLGDGTIYRLGGEPMPRLNDGETPILKNPDPNKPSATTIQELWRSGNNIRVLTDYMHIEWHVNQVTDPFGNQIIYTYLDFEDSLDTLRNGETPVDGNLDGAIGPVADTGHRSFVRPAAVDKIYYNFQDHLQNVEPDFYNLPNLDVAKAGTVVNYEYIDNKYLWKIQADHLNQPFVEYVIDSIPKTVRDGSCDVKTDETNAIIKRETTTRVVNDIIKTGYGFVEDGENPPTEQAPVTSFSYEALPNFYNDNEFYAPELEVNGPCFYYHRLTKVDNGLGGRVEFEYDHDGRTHSGNEGYERWYTASASGPTNYPPVVRNYWVKSMMTYDGTKNSDGTERSVKTEYNRTAACYVQKGSYGHRDQSIPDFDGKQPTDQYGKPKNACVFNFDDEQVERELPNYGLLSGWQHVNIRTYTFNQTGGQVVSAVDLEFEMDYSKGVGKILKRSTLGYDGSGDLELKVAQEVTTTYHSYDVYGALFRPVEKVTTKTFDLEDNSRTMLSYNQTHYSETDRLFGNVTSTISAHLDDEIGDDRIYDGTVTERYYEYSNRLNDGYWWPSRLREKITYDWQLTGPTAGEGHSTETKTELNNTSYGYDSDWSHPRPTSVTTGLGDLTVATQTGFDAFGNVNWTVDPKNRPTQIEYDSTYNLYPVSVKNAASQETRFCIIGIMDFMESSCEPKNEGENNDEEAVPVGPVGTLWQVEDSNNLLTTYKYDSLGRLVNVYGPADQGVSPAVSYTYSDDQYPLTIEARTVNNLAPIVLQTFDGFGRVTRQQSRGADIFHEGSEDKKIVWTTFEYDELGQLVKESIPHVSGSSNVAFTEYVYPHTIQDDNLINAGDMIVYAPDQTESTTFNRILNAAYDEIFDGYRLVTAVIDGNKNARASIVDHEGNLERLFEFETIGSEETLEYATYAQTMYTYDGYNRLATVTDAQGNETRLSYDALGRKTLMDDPDMGRWHYEYDLTGNLTKQTDANDDVLCFSYDILDRVKTKWSGNCNNIPARGDDNWLAAYTYDTAVNDGVNLYGGLDGQLTAISWASRSAAGYDVEMFEYDNEGRNTAHLRLINGHPFRMEYSSFDRLNRPRTVTYPDNEQVDITFDRLGEETLTAGVDSLVTSVTYNERGQMTSLTRDSGGQSTIYNYFGSNNNFRLYQLQHGGSVFGPASIATYEYAYDKVGNITSILTFDSSSNSAESPADTQIFEYDHLYRLTSASGTGSPSAYTRVFEYDTIGNIQSILREDGITRNYNYYDGLNGYDPFVDEPSIGPTHPTHHLPHAVVTAGSHTFRYDNNGNMLERNDKTGSYTQEFDSENRLVKVTAGNSDVTQFFYDAAGQRTMTINPDGSITYYPFPNYEEVHEACPLDVVCEALPQEAESGNLSGEMRIILDENASNGRAIVGSNVDYETLVEADKVDFKVSVQQGGEYFIEASVLAPSFDSNSLFWTVDSQPGVERTWHMDTDDQYAVQKVSDGGDPEGGNAGQAVYLPAGERTISFYHRESGVRLDRIKLLAKPPESCGELLQEAENGVLHGRMALITDGNASGGQAIGGSGADHSSGIVTADRVDYCVTISEAGEYAIDAAVIASDLSANSMFWTVNGEPSSGWIWHMSPTSSYGQQAVSEGGRVEGGNSAKTISLSEGDHIISFYHREQNVRLDRFALKRVAPPPTPTETATPTSTPTPFVSCGDLAQEAENGTLYGRMEIISDVNASDDQAIGGSGIEHATLVTADRADYCFTITQPGDYYINAVVKAPSFAANSMFWTVDNQPSGGRVWHMSPNSNYTQQAVSNGGNASGGNLAEIVNLSAGDHMLSFYLREPDVLLDRFEIVDASSQPTPTPYPTSVPGAGLDQYGFPLIDYSNVGITGG
ncbi:MAG: hypothetical protein AAF902_04795, partial [Chloroflexota bacterium]